MSKTGCGPCRCHAPGHSRGGFQKRGSVQQVGTVILLDHSLPFDPDPHFLEAGTPFPRWHASERSRASPWPWPPSRTFSALPPCPRDHPPACLARPGRMWLTNSCQIRAARRAFSPQVRPADRTVPAGRGAVPAGGGAVPAGPAAGGSATVVRGSGASLFSR